MAKQETDFKFDCELCRVGTNDIFNKMALCPTCIEAVRDHRAARRQKLERSRKENEQ
jgi:hypothetical protein